MKREFLCVILAISVAAICSPFGSSQTTTASVSGTVADETAGVLPGARVTITNVATGIQRAVTTDGRGRFVAPQLPPGTYDVTVVIQGFETMVRSGITLTVGQEVDLKFAMKLGAVTQQVTITGEAPLVDTTGSSVSGVVEEKRITELPLNGRDFTQLALVQPGVIAVRNADSIATKGFGARISTAGSRADQTGWFLDGTNIKSMSNFGTPGSVSSLLLGVDAVREFQVLTSNYSAEFGGTSGGVINMVTKSGTNGFHGTVYEFHRNDNLDARNFFDRRKPEFKRNQFGFSLGGPVKRDKAFFFGNYEGLRERLGITNVAVVPDANTHRGLLPDGRGGLTPVQVAASVRPYLDLWPLPNGGLVLDRNGFSSGLGELISPASDKTNQHYFVTRADYRLSDNQSLFARFTFDHGDRSRPHPVPITNNDIGTRTRYATVQYERILTPQFLSTSRVAYNRTNLLSDVSVNIDYPVALRLFNPRVPPELSFAGATPFGPSDRDVFGNVQNLYQFSENLIFTRGEHSLKFGFDFQKYGFNNFGGGGDSGDLDWGSLRDFLEDRTFQNFALSVPGTSTRRSFRQNVIGLYFQDNWKWRPYFTWNFGLRYEPYTTPTEKHNRIAVVKDWVKATQFDTNVPFWDNPSEKNFSPRVGFAWDPTEDGKTAVRGGFGIFYVTLLNFYYRSMSQKNPPFAGNIEEPLGNLASALSDIARVGPDILSVNMTPLSGMEVIQYHLDPSYEIKFNLTVERELAGNVSVAAGYLGGRGNHLWRSAKANASLPIVVNGREFAVAGAPRLNPNAGLGDVRYSDAKSFYNGLQTELKKRFSRGFQFQSSYTFSRTMDDSSTATANTDYKEGATSRPYNTKADRSLSALHLAHNFVVNGIWSLPSPSASGFASYLLGGWQLSGIYSASTGTPFSAIITGRNAPDATNTNTQRPDLVAGRSSESLILGGPNRYFDATGFELPPPGFYGNAGRNILIGPGVSNLDFSLTKNTRLGIVEGSRLEFRADFFNILNRANFAIPDFRQAWNANNRRLVDTAGRITRTVTTARQLQFGLKLVF